MMTPAQLTLDDIIQMTRSGGEAWAVSHAERLLELIKEIGEGVSYDPSILNLAVYLHDWGAFSCYAQKGVEHAVRSRKVAETEVMPFLDISPASKSVVLEAIELHDYRDTRPTRSNEALLLREADMLEFLGMIGIAREFARGPKDIQVCYQRILDRRSGIQGRFTLPKAREIAALRLERFAQCLRWLEEESFGIL